jgi:hypothetical protein
MKIHFLFGGEAVTKYRNKGIEALKDVPFGLYFWEDGKSNPFDLLNAYCGWESYTKISEEEFDQLFSQSWS